MGVYARAMDAKAVTRANDAAAAATGGATRFSAVFRSGRSLVVLPVEGDSSRGVVGQWGVSLGSELMRAGKLESAYWCGGNAYASGCACTPLQPQRGRSEALHYRGLFMATGSRHERRTARFLSRFRNHNQSSKPQVVTTAEGAAIESVAARALTADMAAVAATATTTAEERAVTCKPQISRNDGTAFTTVEGVRFKPYAQLQTICDRLTETCRVILLHTCPRIHALCTFGDSTVTAASKAVHSRRERRIAKNLKRQQRRLNRSSS